MNIEIELVGDLGSQTMAATKWKYGKAVSTVQAADYRPYMVILTEHNEFDLVSFYQIKALSGGG